VKLVIAVLLASAVALAQDSAVREIETGHAPSLPSSVAGPAESNPPKPKEGLDGAPDSNPPAASTAPVLSVQLPTSSVTPTTERNFFRNFVGDQRAIITSPQRLRIGDVTWALPLAGLSAGLLVSDAQFSRHLDYSPRTLKRANDLSNYGVAALVAVPAGFYGLSLITHDPHKRETGLLTAEALANAYADTQVLKLAFGRERPVEANGSGRFGQGGSSFPSDHATLAWSAATVLAHEYPGVATQLFAYGAATAVSFARVAGREHFPTDVLIGSALGWYVGRQVFRAHHEPHVGGTDIGEFVRDDEAQRQAASMGSPAVPSDSWVYGAFDRLSALGYVHSAFLGLRPWTRMECARLAQEAGDNLVGVEEEQGEARSLQTALALEFAPELELLGGGRNFGATIDSLYTRVTGISGVTVHDGYHFGQSMINDYGRPYAAGSNVVTGLTSYATAGPLAFYVRAEYQRAPESPGIPFAAREFVAHADLLPDPLIPPGTATPATSRVRTLEAYVALTTHNWQFSYGKQSLNWGPERAGSMMWSDNAEPVNMFRVSRTSPFVLPSVLRFLGEVRSDFFLGQLEGYHFMFTPTGLVGTWQQSLSRQPWVIGQKMSFRPTENLEFGLSRTTVFAGEGYALTPDSIRTALLSTTNPGAGKVNKPGDRRKGFDFTYRLPKLRNWLTFYADGFTDDEFSPLAYWDRSAWTAGLYAPRLPLLPKLDLRVEGVYTDLPIGGAVAHGFFYFNDTWRSGYTNDGNLLGSWIGRQGQGAQAWSTYHFSARNNVGVEFRHQKVSAQFLPNGGTLTDAGVNSEFEVHPGVTVNGGVQVEKWNFPLLATEQKNNVAISIGVTWRPKFGLRQPVQ